MLLHIWETLLFQPLYNALIYIYNNWTDQSLGWAVIYLTLLLRVVLLPLTIKNHLNQAKNQSLGVDVQEVARQYQHDTVLQKEEVRRVLKSKRVSPWAKAVSLGVQALVVVLLYEVFLNGLAGERVIDYLFPWIEYPGQINTMFYGMDIGGVHNYVWAGIVAGWLFLENLIELRKKKGVERKDMIFLFLFPAAIFIVLWILPMMKALFFMTSILFSFVVDNFLKLLIKPKAPKEKTEKVA